MKQLSGYLCLFIFCSFLLVARPAQAEEAEKLTLRLSRDFGYSAGFGNPDIQGIFTLKTSGSEDLVRVVFYLDGEPIGEANQPPFNLQFSTDTYPLGMHSISAIGTTASGRELHSNEIQSKFVSANESWQAGMKFALPILGLVFGAMLLSFLFTFVSSGKVKNLPPGTQRKYGAFGGTVCPKCGRPFSLHLFGLNLLVGKLERCPYCGRWSLVRSKLLTELRAAEAAELESHATGEISSLSEEEHLEKDLQDSRYEEL